MPILICVPVILIIIKQSLKDTTIEQQRQNKLKKQVHTADNSIKSGNFSLKLDPNGFNIISD